jgi:hypothetical protein
MAVPCSPVPEMSSIDRLIWGAGGPRYRRFLQAASVGGVSFVLLQLLIGTQQGFFPIPARDELIWDRVGDAIWTGAPIYYNAPRLTDSFVYAPPLAVVFGLVSWLPIELQHASFFVLKAGCLRIIAGSWMGAGLACWFPLIAYDLDGGNFNLFIAAAIVAAVLGRPRLAIWGALAKFAPMLAIDPREWRLAATTLLVAVAVTLPWLHLWPEWLGLLRDDAGRLDELGVQIQVAWPVRLVGAAALLVLVRTRWARALAATLAIPAFYWATTVVLIAPVAVYVRDRQTSFATAMGTTPAPLTPELVQA